MSYRRWYAADILTGSAVGEGKAAVGATTLTMTTSSPGWTSVEVAHLRASTAAHEKQVARSEVPVHHWVCVASMAMVA
jgi:hypothetical protein